MAKSDDMRRFVKERCEKFTLEKEDNVINADIDIIEYVLDNCELYIKPDDIFFVGVRPTDVFDMLLNIRTASYSDLLSKTELTPGIESYAYVGTYDFSHTAPDWDNIIPHGIYGLRERINYYREKNKDYKAYYDGLARIYDAVLRFMVRCSDYAKKSGKEEMAFHIDALTKRAPSNLYEAMQTSIIYFVIQSNFDRSVPRTLGRIDSLFYPYYINESKENAITLADSYMKALEAFRTHANLPFALGGADENGKSLINDFSYILLDAYKKSRNEDLKLHILCTDDIPKNFLNLAMESVRAGNNSIVFLSDKKVTESLLKLGEAYDDAVNYHVVGCYECGGRNELTCSCNGKVNITKAIEYALNDGFDMLTGDKIGLSLLNAPETFNEFFDEFLRQLKNLCDKAIAATDIWESKNKMLHSAPILSVTYDSAMEKGGDIYCNNTAKYNNSSINAIGLATATDSLYAIKKLVFDEKKLSLQELKDILISNWADNEILRLQCKNKLPKFGNGNDDVDAIARSTVKALSSFISGRPNTKGGCYRLGLFSINWRWEYGMHTAASADGRLSGEALSQNTSASFGCDKEGATAHLLSVASLDTSLTPNGAIVDIDLHSSGVQGDNGLCTLVSTLMTYFEAGGFAVHYNILDTDVLIEAKKFPERYPNLQVRLCGWNVLFSSLSDREKEEFILRSVR